MGVNSKPRARSRSPRPSSADAGADHMNKQNCISPHPGAALAAAAAVSAAPALRRRTARQDGAGHGQERLPRPRASPPSIVTAIDETLDAVQRSRRQPASRWTPPSRQAHRGSQPEDRASWPSRRQVPRRLEARREAIAQNGRGLTWTDPRRQANGGNCYNCHQITKEEISFGTIGPSLYNYGKIRGVSDPAAPPPSRSSSTPGASCGTPRPTTPAPACRAPATWAT
jgi:hypothetical protein